MFIMNRQMSDLEDAIKGRELKWVEQFGGWISSSPIAYSVPYSTYLAISKIVYNKPYTIVKWEDGTTTKSQCAPEDEYSESTGLLVCILKKLGLNCAQIDQILFPKQIVRV